MSKRPPRALPPDPKRRRGIRYVGLHVVWWDDGSWEWIKCVNCGAELTLQESRERGSGASCAAVVTEATKEAILREERRNAEAYLEEKKRPATRRSAAEDQGQGPQQRRQSAANFSSAAKPRGITNEQAKELARLQRAAGEPYGGSGMTAREARAEIQRLKR